MSPYKPEEFQIKLPESAAVRERWPLARTIVHTPTGEESALYTEEECRIIIAHACEGLLLGSFLSGV